MNNTGYIPYAKQWIDEDDIQAVVDVLRGDFLTTGPAVAQFGEAVAEVAGTKYGVAICNGTAALHAAVAAAGIGPGDEVITSPITFAASANCALYVGATPVFADIDPRTYNIDPDDVERKITSRTKAIIPVHFTGQPCDMDRLREIAQRHKLVLIADGAHAIGASYQGKPAGGFADMTRGHHASGRAGQRGFHWQRLGLFDGHHPAVRLHDQDFAIEPRGTQAFFQPIKVMRDHRLKIGVQRGRRGAFEFADLGQDFHRRGDMFAGPDRAHGLNRDAFVLAIGIAVQAAEVTQSQLARGLGVDDVFATVHDAGRFVLAARSGVSA